MEINSIISSFIEKSFWNS